MTYAVHGGKFASSPESMIRALVKTLDAATCDPLAGWQPQVIVVSHAWRDRMPRDADPAPRSFIDLPVSFTGIPLLFDCREPAITAHRFAAAALGATDRPHTCTASDPCDTRPKETAVTTEKPKLEVGVRQAALDAYEVAKAHDAERVARQEAEAADLAQRRIDAARLDLTNSPLFTWFPGITSFRARARQYDARNDEVLVLVEDPEGLLFILTHSESAPTATGPWAVYYFHDPRIAIDPDDLVSAMKRSYRVIDPAHLGRVIAGDI